MRKRKRADKPCRALGVGGLGSAAPDQAGAVGEQARSKRRRATPVYTRAAAPRNGCMDQVQLQVSYERHFLTHCAAVLGARGVPV